MRKTLLPLGLCGLLVLPTILAAGEHWPGWRGPTGMGTSGETNLPLAWGGKAGDGVLWKAPLFPSDKVRRDQNQSSPIVWGDHVFVTVSYWPEGRAEKEYPEHHVLCFNARDGSRRWDTTVPPGPWKLTDLRGGYTAPTPATDGERVVVIFGSAVVAGLDFEGAVVWRKEITPHFFDVAWGASPVLYRDTALIVCDQLKDKKASRLLILDLKTGDVRRDVPRPTADWTHSTPLPARVGEKTRLLLATANGPQGLDPESGEVIWSFHAPQRVGDTVTPVYRAGQLYVDSGRGGIGLAVDATGTGDVTKTHLKWKLPVVPEGFSSPVLVGEYLYRLHAPGVVSCRKWPTGEEVFKERLEGIDPAVSPVATADGRIYCASAGKSVVLKAGPTLEVLARNDLGDPSRASPAVAAGRLYLKGGRYLYCIGRR
jgi:outer membrane protein assembly factor BamB